MVVGSISANLAIAHGGGLHVTGSTITLGFNTITTNTASLDGGGLFLSDSTAQLLHNRIANNSGSCGIAGSGAGLYIYGGEATLNGNVVDSNTGVCQGGGLSDWGGGGTIITGARNVRDDPAFLDPNSRDYHIGPASAAIDSGVETDTGTDLDHEPRPYQSPDLGADEYWPPGTLKTLFLPLVICRP